MYLPGPGVRGASGSVLICLNGVGNTGASQLAVGDPGTTDAGVDSFSKQSIHKFYNNFNITLRSSVFCASKYFMN